jgi:hypothetical protein
MRSRSIRNLSAPPETWLRAASGDSSCGPNSTAGAGGAGPGRAGLHNGPLSRPQQFRVAQAHAGPRAIFTAAEILGLTG